jgi:hypothetical protein
VKSALIQRVQIRGSFDSQDLTKFVESSVTIQAELILLRDWLKKISVQKHHARVVLIPRLGFYSDRVRSVTIQAELIFYRAIG